jgi:tRNA 2-thiouridine synthesizing protein E
VPGRVHRHGIAAHCKSEKGESLIVLKYEVDGRAYNVDEDGFLQEPEIWNDAVAKDFALSEGIEALTDNHWKVIHYLRNYYVEFGIAPMVRKICKETGFKLKDIYDLFPSGPAKGACKLAGLPKPTGCV